MLILTAENIQSLKQTNISIDGEKTKSRVEMLWKAAKSTQKQEIRDLASVAAATVYRIYNTGSVSAKLAIAFAQVLNISPFYLTGEADEPGEFAEADLLRLLEQQGYKKLLAEIAPPAEQAEKPKRKYTRKPKPQADAEAEQAEEPAVEEAVAEVAAAEIEEAIPEAPTVILTEENLQALLHAMVIRANAAAAGAAVKLGQVQEILLS